jgi:hypothetical protein
MRIISVTLSKPILYLNWILTPKRLVRDPGVLAGGGVFNNGSGERNFASEFETRKLRLLQ